MMLDEAIATLVAIIILVAGNYAVKTATNYPDDY